MLNLRKKTLALAVAAGAAVLGAGIGTGIPTAQAQEVSPNYLGQALIYPYYSVRAGWRTFIHVINTSDSTVAAKVIFHDAKYSRDVLDFVLVLSPLDMWTGVVEERNGAPGVRPTDNTCTVSQIGSGKFAPFDPLGTITSVDDMREGYVEIIQMGSPLLETDPIAVAAAHNPTTGLPKDCGTVANGFKTPGVGALAWTGYLANALTGKYDMVNVDAATLSTSASRAVAIQDFNPAGDGTGQLMYPAGGALPNLACVQMGPNPDTCDNITAMEDALEAVSILNEWVLNPGLGELSSWVLTFPTKALSLDPDSGGTATTAAADNPIFPKRTACVVSVLNTYGAGVPVDVKLLNREENLLQLSPKTIDLCYETNVINFTNSTISSTGLLSSVVAKTIKTDNLNTSFLGGWMSLTHRDFAADDVLLPAVGFNITARTKLGDAVLYDHAYPGRNCADLPIIPPNGG